MSKQLTYLDWLKRLPATDAEYPLCSCPVCSNIGLAYQYFGFTDSEFGWKLVWCNNCCSGIRVSRARIPSGENVLIDETEQREFLASHSDIHMIS
jgi:hypothetical protein